MPEYVDKIVFFHKYCHRCEFKNTSMEEDPCDHCLEQPARQNSHKPAFFKEKIKEEEDEQRN